MTPDSFALHGDSPTAPASHCFAVAPHATDDLERVTKALYIGVAGDVTLRAAGDTQDVRFRNLPAGMILDVRVRAVRTEGTTATALIGLA